MEKAYIILKVYTKTGHVVPLGVVLDKKIAIEETYQARQRYNDEEIEIQLLESHLWEERSDVCCGICDHFHKIEHAKKDNNLG